MTPPCSYANGAGHSAAAGDFLSCHISSDGSFCWAHAKRLGTPPLRGLAEAFTVEGDPS